jgi:hypothetical protein
MGGNMEIDTATNAVVDNTAAAGIGEQYDVVNAADLFTPEANGAAEQTNEQQTDATTVHTEDRRYTSDEMSNAVKQRLKQERRKAAYVLGEELLRERMKADNVTEEEALRRIREDRIKQKAAEFKADPEKGFAEILRQKDVGETAQTPEARVDRLYSDIVEDIKAGKVPTGFDLDAYMSDQNNARQFVELYEAFGMEKACAYAMRMNAPAPTKAEVNRSLPKPINTNNAYTPAMPDIWSMSSEDFAKMAGRMDQAHKQGKRVNF